jgi:hypothetical protein
MSYTEAFELAKHQLLWQFVKVVIFYMPISFLCTLTFFKLLEELGHTYTRKAMIRCYPYILGLTMFFHILLTSF